ncbi:MAG TPA: DUF2306 domain-containing protein [Candidatus Acidoferrum sp.]|jgi:hypothetical protein|nr:DUF2306 domain-containing protein [Candidatus Acidoferrum sp.]
MAHATIPALASTATLSGRARLAAKILAWAGVLTLAVGFVIKYVLFYYRHYDAASFDVYWPRRGWLFLHINGGALALLMGPWQFWTGLRQRNLAIHRWAGRLFLLGVALGVTGAVGLSITSTYGWGFAVGLMGLASAWLITTSMAYYTIRKGLVALHKEWMIRAYVVTFAFVTFRILSDYGPTSRLQPENDRSLTISWVCWVVPLAVTEMIFQMKRVRAATSARR